MNCEFNTVPGSNGPAAMMGTIRIPIVASGSTQEAEGRIILWWKNARAYPEKFIPIKLQIYCWDTRGMRHETKYELMAAELGSNVLVVPDIAPGVSFGRRHTIIRPAWRIKLSARLQKLPLVGKIFRKLA
jgi:hypothetical protein